MGMGYVENVGRRGWGRATCRDSLGLLDPRCMDRFSITLDSTAHPHANYPSLSLSLSLSVCPSLCVFLFRSLSLCIAAPHFCVLAVLQNSIWTLRTTPNHSVPRSTLPASTTITTAATATPPTLGTPSLSHP